MRPNPIAIAASFLLIVVMGAFAPTAAAACHTGGWVRTDTFRQEAVGVGSTDAGVYTKEKSWRENCQNTTSEYFAHCATTLDGMAVDPVTVGPVTVTEVRILGMVIVPETTSSVEVPGGTTPPVDAPVGHLAFECLSPPVDAGVYVDDTDAGTDLLADAVDDLVDDFVDDVEGPTGALIGLVGEALDRVPFCFECLPT